MDSTPRPTADQVKQSTADARDGLGAPVKQDKAFDFGGDALVFVPRAGRDRADDAPVVSGRTATLDRGSVQADKPQNLLAVGCLVTGGVLLLRRRRA